MKRQISVSIFLAILVIALTWLYIKYNNETATKEKEIQTENDISKEESITISQEYLSCPYYLKEIDGRVVVFLSENEKIYMETSIDVNALPLEIQHELDDKIYIQSEGDLYDFLESYSS